MASTSGSATPAGRAQSISKTLHVFGIPRIRLRRCESIERTTSRLSAPEGESVRRSGYGQGDCPASLGLARNACFACRSNPADS